MSMLAQTPPPRSRAPARRARNRFARPGLSLIAQGEPLVWLTGGAIVLCLTMIIGLLVLVLASGLPTFWPSELVRIERKDASALLGEVTRTESFTPYTAEARDPAAAAPEPIRRRFLRTGNFELTNEHYTLVADTEIKPDGESLPKWAVTVERLEWGRFYGEPQQFARRHPRTPTAAEQELVAIDQFLEANRWRLTPEQTTAFETAVTPLKSALDQSRVESLTHFVGQFSSEDRRIEVLLEDGQALPLADVAPTHHVGAIREVWTGADSAWQQFRRFHQEVRDRSAQRHRLEQHDIGHVNEQIEEARLQVRRQELEHQVTVIDQAMEWKNAEMTIRAVEKTLEDNLATLAKLKARFPEQQALVQFGEEFIKAQRSEIEEQLVEPRATRDRLQAVMQKFPEPVVAAAKNFVEVHLAADEKTVAIQKQIAALNDENARYELLMQTADGQEKGLSLAEIVRAYPANQLSLGGKFGVYLSRWEEFLTEDPREANSEGGVFPAIWGTVVMTLIMSLLVAPFGVLAALYLREYAQAGLIVSAIRISISNLAGVPSIVFGVFGLGFFCYVVGSFVDGGPRNAGLAPLPPKAWWFSLIALALCGATAFACGLNSVARHQSGKRWRRWLGYASIALWLVSLTIAGMLIFGSPYFSGFFAAALPNPTFGKGGLMWASLTLALLTLPVVIVATEEALAAVPNSLREGSYACGGSKWQTIRRIVLPHAMPGIMTGMILAMARGAGETAPLMLVGAVKLAPELPIDATFPFVHFDRSFMHLGFHIFDVGFQSQNSEAAKPMVFTTTLLLILIIAVLNLAAVAIRSHLRKRFLGGQF